MPSLLQLLGVKKGSDSPTSRRGFSPFGRKTSSASRGRQHLRTRSDNSVVCNQGACSEISKGYSPVGRNGHDSEPYEAKYERYRKIYLATSPERELNTLNAALVNVRKWLKKKHECLKLIQGSSTTRPGPGTGASGAPPALDNKLDTSSGADKLGIASSPTAYNKLGCSPEDREALLKKLVAEAGHQQEAVDVLLDRGRRYLYQRANITLEVDLENLAFLWNAYTKQLYSLHDPLEPPPFTPEHSFSASLRGKENLQSTPVRWRKSGKAFSESNGVLPAEFSPDYPKCKLPFEADESFNSADPEPFNPNTTFALHKEAHSPNEACNPKIISASPEQHSGRGEEKFNQEESTREVVGVRPVAENTAAVPVAVGNTSAVSSQDCVDEESKEPSGEDRGKCGPRPEKSKIIAVSNWPDNNGKGWLRVPGEGIFTSRQRQKQRLRLSSNGDTSLSSDSDRSSNGVAEDGRSLESESPTAVNQTQAQVDDDGDQCMLPARRSSDQSADQLDGLLGKRSKEIHNEQQQKQQQQRHLQQKEENDSNQGENSAVAAGLSNDLSDLRALEEKLTMELEAAAREINGSLMDASISESRMDLSTGILDESNTSSSEAKTADESGTDNPDDLDFPTEPKRRRMNLDTPSSLSSCSGSPLISGDNSLNVTPSSSPAGTLRRDFKKHYKKDELWKAIESNYQYLMDKEIIETCQSTESDLSHDEDFVPNVSFAEFLKQYQELIDWLNQAQRNTQRTVTSLSEKYLNQMNSSSNILTPFGPIRLRLQQRERCLHVVQCIFLGCPPPLLWRNVNTQF